MGPILGKHTLDAIEFEPCFCTDAVECQDLNTQRSDNIEQIRTSDFSVLGPCQIGGE